MTPYSPPCRVKFQTWSYFPTVQFHAILLKRLGTNFMRGYGFTRRDIRMGGGAGKGVASEHFQEMIGSSEFNIYRHPNKKIKGYEALRDFLESQGCQIVHIVDEPAPIGRGFETIRVTNRGDEIPGPLLKRAHNWSHQRNLLHMFYKKRAAP